MAESKYVPVKLPSESLVHLETVRAWIAERLPDVSSSQAIREALRLAAAQIIAQRKPEKNSKRA